MDIPEIVPEIIQRAGLIIAGTIVEIPSVENGVFIPVLVTRGGDGRQLPAESAFAAAAAELRSIGIRPEFLLSDDASVLAEEGLRGSLKTSFPSITGEVHLSVEKTKTNVWFCTKSPIEHDEIEELEKHVASACELYRLPAPRLTVLGNPKLPTRLELLRSIRRFAPVDCDKLKDALEAKGYEIPSLDWINKQFDLLRKAGFLVRMQDRSYALTADGLRKLGTVKGRLSPDIDRLLALAQGRI